MTDQLSVRREEPERASVAVQRVAEETNKHDGAPPGERLRSLKADEEAIGRAVKRLELPRNPQGARLDQEAAAENAARAADLLDTQRPWEARARMEEVKQRLVHYRVPELPNPTA